MLRLITTIKVVILTAMVCGCERPVESSTLLDGASHEFLVDHFDALVDNHVSEVGGFRGLGAGLYWQSRGSIYDRYILSMVYKTSSRNTPVRISEATVRLYEYRVVEGFPVEHSPSGFLLGEIDQKKFENIISAESLFLEIGVEPEIESPVVGIDKALRAF